MSAFDEELVREYFEAHGFHVRQRRGPPPGAPGRGKAPPEQLELELLNPAYRPGPAPGFALFTNDLPKIERALVVVRPWHATQKFSPGLLTRPAELAGFLEKNLGGKKGGALFPDEPLFDGAPAAPLRVLVVPALPQPGPERERAEELLRGLGVGAALSFRSILHDFLNRLEGAKANAPLSEAARILRTLRNYDLLVTPQMDLGLAVDRRR